MKILRPQLVFVILIRGILCNESILSKFHQNNYKLKDVRFELISYDKDYLKFFEIKAFKYNRTTTAHNFTFIFKVDMEDKVEVIAQGYKFLSNEYRHFPMRFQVNLQKGFEANAIGLRSMITCGNIVSFRFYKDIAYRACNFVVDESHFPPLIPNGKYKLELTLLFLNKEFAVMYVYNEVYTPMTYPKN